jgi:Ni,Fe-hydrogenase III large subunit/Ni,Fe-hydrogenase III component G
MNPVPLNVDVPPSTRSINETTAAELLGAAAALLNGGWRLALVAAHDDGVVIRIVYVFMKGPPDERTELVVRLDASNPVLPSLASLSFVASRFEREIKDLFGVELRDHPQARRLVLHQHWPEGWFPMRRGAGPIPSMMDGAGSFPFIPVDGPGVYEIPVGPVHAGLIEPGHFRFFVVGETILRMKARLWFTHKGIERLMEGKSIEEGLQIAERVSGDTAVGHSLAYVMAIEEALGVVVSQSARELRATLLEMERLYNHVADLGALCNDVGFSIANAFALDIRERLLRLNSEVTGHRLLRAGVFLGGARVHRLAFDDELSMIEHDIEELVALVLSNALVLDRFIGTAVLSHHDAVAMGTLGVVARASGYDVDARIDHPFVAMPIDFATVSAAEGDVKARFDVRVQEIRVSLACVRAWNRVAGDELVRVAPTARNRPVLVSNDSSDVRSGLGVVEGWRGTIVHRVEIDEDGLLSRVKIVDPSFMNWPALPICLAETIIPDFPLANKSFNLSYAGNDL